MLLIDDLFRGAAWLVLQGARAVCRVRGHRAYRVIDEAALVDTSPVYVDGRWGTDVRFEIRRSHQQCRRCDRRLT